MKGQHFAIFISFLAVACSVFALWKTSDLLNTSIQKQSETNQQFLLEALKTLKEIQTQPTISTTKLASPKNTAEEVQNTPVSPGNELTNIFDEPNAHPDQAAKIDKIKTNFESLFVSYQYLSKCQLAEDIDYHLLNSALIHQLSSLNAPSRVQFDILTAAKGTYDEIYSRSPCDTPNIGTMQQQFKNYLTEAQKNRFVM